MSKYIIREVEPEACDFSFYFDNDGLSEIGGDFCNTLFIIRTDWGRVTGFNAEIYKTVQARVREVLDGFNDVRDGLTDYDGRRYTFKRVMQENAIDYSPRRCHELKEWAEQAGEDEPESIAEFLTITTGKKWTTGSAHGYCQGDYCEMVYCSEHYRDGVQHYGEIWLGCGKEFGVMELGENGEEINAVYGYIIADCQARTEEDYKRLVCEWAGIDEQNAALEMIDDCYTVTRYKYRTA